MPGTCINWNHKTYKTLNHTFACPCWSLIIFCSVFQVFDIRSRQPEFLRSIPATQSQLKHVFDNGESGLTTVQTGSLNYTRDADLAFLGEVYLIKQIINQVRTKMQNAS